MKKLLYFLGFFILLLSFSSCKEESLQKTDLPIEVVNLKEVNKFDTLLVVETKERVYTFENKTEEYQGSYVKNNDYGWVTFLAVVFLFLGFVLGLTISS